MRRFIPFLAAAIWAVMLVTFVAIVTAHARDSGWEDMPAEVRQWYKDLRQPDNPRQSCCGLADGYYADEFEVEDDHFVAIITDTRDDTFPDGSWRPHIEPGTRITVPNSKVMISPGNPT